MACPQGLLCELKGLGSIETVKCDTHETPWEGEAAEGLWVALRMTSLLGSAWERRAFKDVASHVAWPSVPWAPPLNGLQQERKETGNTIGF